MQSQSLFITGTDTGVGKTVVTALLALHLKSQGINVGIMKPFATGCSRQDGELVNEDACWLKEITGVDDDLHLINPVRFEEPLAPLAAMRRVQSSANLASRDLLLECMSAYQELQRRHECVLVEGVGGLMVPLLERGTPSSSRDEASKICTVVDLINDLGLPVVIVARRTLGTINHTVLTCSVPLHAPAHFASLIFCDAQPVEENDIAAQTSSQIIEEITELPVWGTVPYLTDLSVRELSKTANLLFAMA